MLANFVVVTGPLTYIFKSMEKCRESKMPGLPSRKNWVLLWLTSPPSQKKSNSEDNVPFLRKTIYLQLHKKEDWKSCNSIWAQL